MSKEKNEQVEMSREEIMNSLPVNPPKRKQVVSGAKYHNFEETPLFVGQYVGDHINDEGKLIGYDFVTPDGELSIISNSHSITKALDTEVDGTLVRDSGKNVEITFMGKTEMANGKPFNRFSVVLLG
jgi:hypothetical protein